MKHPHIVLKLSMYIILIGMLGFQYSCTPVKMDPNTDAGGPAPEASFTMTQVGSNANRYVVSANTKGVLAVKWDKGDGSGAVLGKTIDTFFFPDAGIYTVTLTAIGKGGVSATSSKQLTIATSDPVAGNLVAGGKMNPGDDAKWTKITIGSPGVNFAISNGKMIASGGGGGHSAIYQAIQVEANKDYRFSMIVSGNGATDVWFEVYFGTVVPANGTDYSSGGNRLGLNTWAGCGKTPFNGNLATIACTGSMVGKNGVVRFAQAGTIYLLIKSGGADLGAGGIAIGNVELRGI